MIRASLFIGAFLLLASCTNNDLEPPRSEKSIFTLNTDPVDGTGTAYWLMVHRADGNLIFSKKYSPGETVIASSNMLNEGDFINITLMQYTVGPAPGVIYNLNSYLNIPQSETWRLQSTPGLQINDDYLGKFKVMASGFTSSSKMIISDARGRTGTDFVFDVSGPGGYASESSIFSDARDFFFSSRDREGNLGYKYFQNVLRDTNYVVTPTDLTPAENVIKASIDQPDYYQLTVAGASDAESVVTNGYVVQDEFEQNPTRSQVSVSYPAMFSSFRTAFLVTNANGNYYFNSIGPRPDTIAFPTDHIFEITDRSFSNFEFTGDADFTQRKSTWQYSNSWDAQSSELEVDIRWTVHSPKGVTQKFLQLPSNFSAIYPELSFGKLVHTDTRIGLHGYPTFDETINVTFKNQPQPVKRAYYSVDLN